MNKIATLLTITIGILAITPVQAMNNSLPAEVSERSETRRREQKVEHAVREDAADSKITHAASQLTTDTKARAREQFEQIISGTCGTQLTQFMSALITFTDQDRMRDVIEKATATLEWTAAADAAKKQHEDRQRIYAAGDEAFKKDHPDKLNIIEIISSQCFVKPADFKTSGEKIQLTPQHVMNRLIFHLREGKWQSAKFRKDQARYEATHIEHFCSKIIRDVLLKDPSPLAHGGPADDYRKGQGYAVEAIKVNYPPLADYIEKLGQGNGWREWNTAITADAAYQTKLAQVTKTWHTAAQPLMDLYCETYRIYHTYYAKGGELPSEQFDPEVVKEKIGWLGK